MCFSTKCTGVWMSLLTMRGLVEKSGCMPSLPWSKAAREASGNSSWSFRRWMSSGLCLQTSTTFCMNSSGSYLKLSMACSSENTQYLSLNLKTPKFGFPGMSSPFFEQIVNRQNPRKSNGMCMKSGVFPGISLNIGFDGSPSCWLSTVFAIWFS